MESPGKVNPKAKQYPPLFSPTYCQNTFCLSAYTPKRCFFLFSFILVYSSTQPPSTILLLSYLSPKIPKSTLIFSCSLQSLAFSPTLNYPCFSQMTSLSRNNHFILLFKELPFVTLTHSLPILSLLRLLSLISPLSQFSFYPFYFYLYVIFENWTNKNPPDNLVVFHLEGKTLFW